MPKIKTAVEQFCELLPFKPQEFTKTEQQLARQARDTLARLFDLPKKPKDASGKPMKLDWQEKLTRHTIYGGYINSFAFLVTREGQGKNDGKPLWKKGRTYRYARVPKCRDLADLSGKLPEFCRDKNGDHFDLRPIGENESLYITRNPATKQRQNGEKFVYSYRNIVLDISAHDIPVEEANRLARIAANRLKKDVDGGKFAGYEPNVILMTGRGIQVVWSIEPLDGRKQAYKNYYDQACRLLCNLMDKWLKAHAELEAFALCPQDARNGAGLMRMPGSYNVVVRRMMGEEFARVVAYNPRLKKVHKVTVLRDVLQQPELIAAIPEALRIEMANEMVAKSHKKTSRERDVKIVPYSVNSAEINLVGDNDYDFSEYNAKELLRSIITETEKSFTCVMTQAVHRKRYENIVQLLKDTYYPNKISGEMRGRTMFVLCNLGYLNFGLQGLMGEMERQNKIMFDVPLTEEELQKALKASFKKFECGKYYRLSNDYICRFLQLNKAELPPCIDYQQQKTKRLEHKRTRAQEKSVRNMVALCLHNAGLTFETIGDLFGRTRQTVSYWTKVAEKAISPIYQAKIEENPAFQSLLAQLQGKVSAMRSKLQVLNTNPLNENRGFASGTIFQEYGKELGELVKATKSLYRQVFKECFTKPEEFKPIWRAVVYRPISINQETCVLNLRQFSGKARKTKLWYSWNKGQKPAPMTA